jgi:acyl-CoA thioester hydrolase
MPNASSESKPVYLVPHITQIRVRYCEIDGQGRVHNSQYLNYFERGRVEMLRSFGISYKDLEATGLMLVVKSMQVEFHSPAEFDEELTLLTRLQHCFGGRIVHRYELKRTSEETDAGLVATATSSIACVDRTGKVRKLPSNLQLFKDSDGENA